MNTHRFPSQVVLKGFLVVLLVMLAFQSFGMNGLAALATPSHYFQEVENSQALTCGCLSTNIQIVLLIDDSGSMQTNDPQHLRNQIAKDLVNGLTTLHGDPVLRLQDVQVAVIHFTNDVIEDDPKNPAVKLKPELIKITASTVDELFRSISWQPEHNQMQTTDFTKPFEKAKDLFAEGDCTHRSILLFTDGTPEGLHGRLTGDELAKEFENVRSNGQGIPQLDGIYVIGFRVNANYLNEEIKKYWSDIVNWSDIVEKLSTSQDKVPRLVLYSSEEFASQLKKITASSNKINFTELLKYQNLIVRFDNEPVRLQPGKQSDINFKLVDASGDVELPGDDPASPLKLNVSVIPVAQEAPLDLTQAGDHYRFFWTPMSSRESQFKVEYSLVDASGDKLLDCSGIVALPVDPAPISPIVLTLIIGAPRLPALNDAVTLPVQLNYEGNRARASSPPKWTVSAKAEPGGQDLKATVNTINADRGGYELTIEPIGDARKIQVQVGATTKIDGQTITIPHATTTIEISPPPACDCDGSWTFWFWPLAILLAGLLIVLLVLRFRSERTEKNDQGEKLDTFRTRGWHLLFLPLLILLILLALNRLLWCCVIPLWLFLASILILLIILLPGEFIPREVTTRRRPWWMVILLLLPVLIWYISVEISEEIAVNISWLLSIVFLIWIGRWYIRPIPTPVPPLPSPLPVPPSPEPERDDSDRKDGFARDDLTELEGIEEEVQNLLNGMGIYTFKGLVKADTNAMQDSLNEQGWHMIVPTTWPKQARLAEIARESGQGMDREIFEDYLDYLKGGRIPGKSKIHLPDRPDRSRKDDLTLIEGIGPRVEELLNESGITTFEELAERDIENIQSLLNEKNLQYKNPKTWPLQARLANIASASGKKEDWDVFRAYLTYLKDGLPPEEWNKPQEK